MNTVQDIISSQVSVKNERVWKPWFKVMCFAVSYRVEEFIREIFPLHLFIALKLRSVYYDFSIISG